jgi:hypothetical protein
MKDDGFPAWMQVGSLVAPAAGMIVDPGLTTTR